MTSPSTPPILDYSNPPPQRRKICKWALFAPVVAVGIFVLTAYLGVVLLGMGHTKLSFGAITIGPLSSIMFSVYALRKIRQSGGLMIGKTIAILAICFSICTGLLCPGFAISLESSKHLAYTTATGARMMNIGKACRVYADDNNDHFPPHLAVLLTTHAITPKELIDLNAPITLTPFPESRLVPPSDWRSIAAEVETHSDFIYVGADLTNSDDTEIIVVYTKLGRIHKHMKFPEESWDGQGRLVGYADGHTELVLDSDLAGVFGKSNAARIKLGLPPIVMDGPAPMAPSPLIPATTAPETASPSTNK